MPPLQRHGLVYLSTAGWAGVLARAWDAEARACLEHWAAQQLPLVVTRQIDCSGSVAADGEVALGLPAPLCWSRRRIALRVPRKALLYSDEFPRMAAVAPLLPRAVRAGWVLLQRALDDLYLPARVYGSHGWQQLSGLAYLRATSDLDLLVRVADADDADAAVHALANAGIAAPRLDGELLFPHGAAVAWREWQAWRAGDAAAVLVKRRDGVALERGLGWLALEAVA